MGVGDSLDIEYVEFGDGHGHEVAVARWDPGQVPTPVWSHRFNWYLPVAWASRQSKSCGLRVEVICNRDVYRCASDHALKLLRAAGVPAGGSRLENSAGSRSRMKERSA